MRTTDIVTGAPAWVYVLLVVLILLGARRLRTREMPVIVAMIAPAAFLAWSIAGVIVFAAQAGAGIAVGAWFAGAAVGALTAVLLPEPRGQRLRGGTVCFSGSWVPLILYVGVFVVRFACGAWAAIKPEQAVIATTIGVAVSAAMTTRLVVGVTRWR